MIEALPVEKIEISKEEVSYWRREVEASRKFRKQQFIDRIQYKKLIEYYEGKQVTSKMVSEELATIINEFYPAFRSILDNIYVQNPTMQVEARSPQADGGLQPLDEFILRHGPIPHVPLTAVLKSALQYAVDTHDLKTASQLAAFDLMFAGVAFIEVNHEIQKSYEPKDEQPSLISDVKESVMGGIESMVEKVSGFFNKDSESKQEVSDRIASEQKKAEEVKLDRTYISWWNPLEILLDYRAKYFKQSRFIGKEKEFTISEFKDSYPEFKDKIPTSSITKTIDYADHADRDNRDLITVTEVQILKHDGLYILHIADGISDDLCYYKHPVTTNDFTVKYGCIDKYGKLYPISRARLAKKPQDELNHYATIETEHADRSQKKIGVFMDGLTDSGKNAVTSSDPYAIVGKKVPTAVFEPMPVGGIAPEVQDMQAKMGENINKITGSNELQKSGKSDSQFATQDAIKNQAFQTQVSSVEDALGDLLGEVVNTLSDIILQLWDGEYFFKITGMPGAEMWYRPEMGKLTDILIGDYLVKIDITSAQKKNPLTERSELREVSEFLFSVPVQQILMQNGKRVSIAFVEQMLNAYKISPQTALEDVQQAPMPMGAPIGGPQQMGPPVPPNAPGMV